jgi:hypothetical protein
VQRVYVDELFAGGVVPATEADHLVQRIKGTGTGAGALSR